MKKSLLVLAGVLGLASALQAQTVSIAIDAGQLRGALGTTAEPVGGLLQLIASPSGTFGAPTTSSYVSGDNVLVLSFPMNINGGTAETFSSLSSIPLISANYTLTPGEKLTLRFYPSLTSTNNVNGTVTGIPSSLTPPAGTTYGQVRSDSIEFGVAGGVPAETAWVVPAAGATVNFEYVTIANGGSYANASAYASNTVAAPEPSTYVLALGGMAALTVFARRRKVA